MRSMIVSTILGVMTTAVAAAVTPVDINGDGTFAAFLGSNTGLVWSNANLLGQANWSTATSFAANSTIEGITWRLPSSDEFRTLYLTQGHSANGQMVASPFTDVQYLWYWTSELDQGNANYVISYSPSNNGINSFLATLSPNPSTGRTAPYTWLVSSPVPESTSASLLLAGLAVIAAVRRTRTLINY